MFNAHGLVVCVYQPWTAADFRDVMEGMPNPLEAGGADCDPATMPTTTEIRRLVVTKIQLKWGAVQGGWPEKDMPYDWANGNP